MKCLLVFILCLFTSPLFSQKQDTLRVLPEIVIRSYESDRPLLEVPASVGLVLNADLARFSNTSIVSAVNTLPGIRMEERSPGSYRFSIRGSSLRSPFGVRNVKVYWNELPVTDAGGNTYLNQFDANAIDQIEIIKGPGSSLYGSGTGGVILLKSPKPARQKKLTGGWLGGSYGQNNYQMALQTGKENSAHYLGYQHQQSDGYREQTRMVRDQFTSTHRFAISDQEQLEAAIFYTDLYYQTPGGLTQAEYDANPQQARTGSAFQPSAVEANAGVSLKSFYTGISNQYQLTPQIHNRTGVYGNFVQFENPSVRNYERRSEQNLGVRSVTDFTFNWGDWQAKLIGGGELTSGFSPIKNYQNQQGFPGSLLSDDEVNLLQYNLFGQGEFTKKNWILTGGLSVNWVGYQLLALSNDPVLQQEVSYDPIVTPRVAVLKKINEVFSVHGNISWGFAPPTLAEVIPSDGIFNTSLKAEKGMQIEVGTRGYFLHRKFFVDAVLYHFALDQTIVVRRAEDGADYFVNAGATDQNGIELLLHWQPSINSSVFSNFKVWTGVTVNDYQFVDYIKGSDFYGGNAVTGVPAQILTGGLDMGFRKGFYWHLTMNYTSSLPLNDANSVFAKSYTLLGSRLGYKSSFIAGMPINFFVGGDNLLDQAYSLGNDLNAFGGRYFNAAAGRNYYAGIQFDLSLTRSR
ncbi:MAG: TonB-dependent receptor plug domain-containing protein, partial [Cyclobacteriaceae bacterium]|nr:TonB-dependent receptor plug domain-containing protein [Cyclobacteriaceae bacterium]